MQCAYYGCPRFHGSGALIFPVSTIGRHDTRVSVPALDISRGEIHCTDVCVYAVAGSRVRCLVVGIIYCAGNN